ncbi:hypothetical protein C8F04DRAFT_1182999 [Mycena alexandri]|uniref:Uncharacterized protein n=1 Tax=Mycena alexandri TaxID=1745969 RepID=A0AAD6SX82_9AGAR|nr:hypothetical protein C8F04DRAFT_1182995 [Mycena alexandri]KAJ7034739.1 hypothetical protein C8F04DRAFT_1182999 [Mycena alexandri]
MSVQSAGVFWERGTTFKQSHNVEIPDYTLGGQVPKVQNLPRFVGTVFGAFRSNGVLAQKFDESWAASSPRSPTFVGTGPGIFALDPHFLSGQNLGFALETLNFCRDGVPGIQGYIPGSSTYSLRSDFTSIPATRKLRWAFSSPPLLCRSDRLIHAPRHGTERADYSTGSQSYQEIIPLEAQLRVLGIWVSKISDFAPPGSFRWNHRGINMLRRVSIQRNTGTKQASPLDLLPPPSPNLLYEPLRPLTQKVGNYPRWNNGSKPPLNDLSVQQHLCLQIRTARSGISDEIKTLQF